jgi:hypothetical protein
LYQQTGRIASGKVGKVGQTLPSVNPPG